MLLDNLSSYKCKLLTILASITRRHPIRGIERFLRLIHNPDKRQSFSVKCIIEYQRGLFINIDTASFIEWFVFFKGSYEIGITQILNRLLKPGCVAIDVGANIGIHSLTMAKCVGSEGKVLAVEPWKEAIERLKNNISLNRLTNVKIINSALSDNQGASKFFVPDKNVGNRGISSLFQHEELTQEVPVNVDTLDNLMRREGLKRLDLIKIDTEGNDFNVILGAHESIGRFRPYIIFEFEKKRSGYAGWDLKKAKDIFNKMNYNLVVINNGHLKKITSDINCANILAVPQ